MIFLRSLLDTFGLFVEAARIPTLPAPVTGASRDRALRGKARRAARRGARA